MKERLYRFIPESEKHLLSLNFLLAEKITRNIRTKDIKSRAKKLVSVRMHNDDYSAIIFAKHISRYLSTIDMIKTNLI